MASIQSSSNSGPGGSLAPLVPEWHSGLSVGNPLLDKQHVVLLELLRATVVNLDDLTSQALQDRLGEILDVASRHCAAEEHHLAIEGFEWLAQHQQEHRAGLDRLAAIRERVGRGEISPRAACSAFASWWHAHLIDMDLPAADTLSSEANCPRGHNSGII